MDKLSYQEEIEPLQSAGLSARTPSLKNFLRWLANLIHQTKEDQEKAGIYLGGEGRD